METGWQLGGLTFGKPAGGAVGILSHCFPALSEKSRRNVFLLRRRHAASPSCASTSVLHTPTRRIAVCYYKYVQAQMDQDLKINQKL